jgi:predicted nucleotidyltransferase component of viral defense system
LIAKTEIMDFAREFGLASQVVEKDYVLGWLLAGIFNHPVIGLSWVFKGGTCLKKCFFETYRFSEDLDFTLSEAKHLDQMFLVSCFREISQWIYDATGIEIPQDLIRFDVYQNHRGGMCAQGRIGYRGPMQRRGDLPRIKLDLTSDEILILEPVIRDVHHPYSDLPADGIQIKSYCFEEVFAEKIRALAERERPRDLYDVVHLFRHDELDPDQSLILSTLEKKCAFKQISVPTMDSFMNRPERNELESEWDNMLAHQLPALPPFNQFWQALPEVIEWVHGLAVKQVKSAIPVGREEIDTTWHPPSMAQAWHTTVPLERVRFAAANRLCVNLHYQNKYRLIEPYSLRRTREGNILLYALRHESNEWRAYRVDRIQGAEITQTPFVPKHAVELTPAGSLSVPDLTPRSGGSGILRSVFHRPSPKKQSFGPIYVIECPFCGKKFKRKKNTTRLNPHKDKYGYPCSGRAGYLVDTKY